MCDHCFSASQSVEALFSEVCFLSCQYIGQYQLSLALDDFKTTQTQSLELQLLKIMKSCVHI